MTLFHDVFSKLNSGITNESGTYLLKEIKSHPTGILSMLEATNFIAWSKISMAI